MHHNYNNYNDYNDHNIYHPTIIEQILAEKEAKEEKPRTYTQDEVIAILVELQLGIEKLQGKYSPYYDEASQHTSEIIQHKINELKGNENGSK